MHELGHILGLDHRIGDPYDLMATTLSSGLRRQPTEDHVSAVDDVFGDLGGG